MDREVIAEKIESLGRCVRRIEEKCPPTPEALMEDVDLQDILTLNLSRAVQLYVDIAAHLVADVDGPAPETMGAAFEVLARSEVISSDLASNLRKAVGFRNIAVHNYEAIDWRIVHAIARTRLTDFKAFANAISVRFG